MLTLSKKLALQYAQTATIHEEQLQHSDPDTLSHSNEDTSMINLLTRLLGYILQKSIHDRPQYQKVDCNTLNISCITLNINLTASQLFIGAKVRHGQSQKSLNILCLLRYINHHHFAPTLYV